MITPTEIIIILAIGLVAGTLGGLLGIGGSIIMIPGLTVILGNNQHLYQAAAMVVNCAVALSATMRHNKAGVVRRDVVIPMLPVALLAILAGVLLSDQFSGDILRRVFAAFLIYVALINAWKLLRKADAANHPPQTERIGMGRLIPLAIIMGGSAGLLGIGGGIITVPLMQVILRLPLRQCIGSTAAVMCMTAPVGAALKLYNLHAVHDAAGDATAARALLIAAILIPTAIIGARIGAHLTHTLPLVYVRAVLVLLLIAASLRMAGILG
ncbi:MAG: sulfite exporter TauE/SafE family protein [Phycisphaerales bacterium]|nr:sulfite exporter TauE/SafE family protein [Phycisphaerales bacterium]